MYYKYIKYFIMSEPFGGILECKRPVIPIPPQRERDLRLSMEGNRQFINIAEHDNAE